MANERNRDQADKRSVFRRLEVWGALITIASFVIAIVSVVLSVQEPQSDVTFEVLSETSLLDVRRPLQDLNVSFRGEDIQESNLSLRIVAINVTNSGEVDLNSSHFDAEVEWGVKLEGAEVLETRLIDANSAYLKDRVTLRPKGSDTILFPQLIFEKDDFFVIEVLLLHSRDNVPSVFPVGKIAGIDEINVKSRSLIREDVGFFAQLFPGSSVIHLVRTVIYLFGSVITILAILFVSAGSIELANNLKARMRRKKALRTRTIQTVGQSPATEYLVARFQAGGMVSLEELQALIEDPQEIRLIAPSSSWVSAVEHPADVRFTGQSSSLEHFSMHPGAMLRHLSAIGVLTQGEDDIPLIDSSFSELVDRLIQELGPKSR